MGTPEDLVLPHIRQLQNYVPGEQPAGEGYIKLNSNENPYPPPPQVLAGIRAATDQSLRLYPDAAAEEVRRRLAAQFGVAPEQTMVGNGSDELLNLIVRCFVGPGHKVAYPYPTYSYYDKLVALQGGKAVRIELDEDFGFPPALAIPDARLTFLANPNAPTGILLGEEQLTALLSPAEGIVVLDEAYIDFSTGGGIDLLKRFANLIIVRTMSKSFSLAGARVGFCFAAEPLIEILSKVKEHYNVNRLSLAAAAAALDQIESVRANADRIRATRSRLSQALVRLGFFVYESQANFVLARLATPPAVELYRALKERRILVRHFSQRRLTDCLRISVGTDRETDALLKALEELLGP